MSKSGAIKDAYSTGSRPLMRNLSSIARRAGLNKLIAEVLASNAAMLKVFEKSGLQVTTKRKGSVIQVTLKFA